MCSWGLGTHGLGAIVISPLRELAMQIFTVLTQIGGTHNMSAGLVIGGNDFIESVVPRCMLSLRSQDLPYFPVVLIFG